MKAPSNTGRARNRQDSFQGRPLGHRFGELLRRIGDGMGGSIPFACLDWAKTKAACRFFADGRVDPQRPLRRHTRALRRLYRPNSPHSGHDGILLPKHGAIGLTKSVNSGRDKDGRWRHHTVCGMLMHSSLAVTVEGPLLELAAVKFWTRKKFKGRRSSRRSTRPVFRSRRKRAFAGSTILGNQSSGSDSRSVAFISVTAKATSTNCIA